MPRKVNPVQLESLKEVIEKYPGKRPGYLARLIGWRREQVHRALAHLDKQGVLLSEDDNGGLWPFEPGEVLENS